MLTTARPAATGHSRLRWLVLAGVFFLSFVTIVDRVAVSAAKEAMSRDLAISNLDFGAVFGAFALGYGILMVPSGWLADRLGPRRFLAIAVAAWSVCTACTGLVHTLAPLVAVRLAFGMAEAGAYPTATRAIYNWFPIGGRGLALGLLNTGSRLGAALGLVAVSASVVHLGWRPSCYLLGAAGLVWAAIWFAAFRDYPPGKDPGPRTRPRRLRPDGPWRAFFASTNFYLILFQYFASNFTFFICLSWLLPYTAEHYRLGPSQAGFYASIPLYCGALATCLGGYAVDAIYRSGRWKLSRVLPAASGFALAALSLAAAGEVQSVQAFIACFGLATLGVDLSMSASWTTCSDIGRDFTGTLSGCMNMMGSVGSFAGSLAFPVLLKATGTPRAYFLSAAALNVAAIVCWLCVRPDRPLAIGE